MNVLNFELVTPLVAKKRQLRVGKTKTGRLYAYTSNFGRDGERALRIEIGQKTKDCPFLPFENPVRVVAIFNRGRADAIGKMETILDAMEGTIYKNDRLAQEVFIVHDCDATTAIVEIREIAQQNVKKTEKSSKSPANRGCG
jgi:hypothetical protein